MYIKTCHNCRFTKTSWLSGKLLMEKQLFAHSLPYLSIFFNNKELIDSWFKFKMFHSWGHEYHVAIHYLIIKNLRQRDDAMLILQWLNKLTPTNFNFLASFACLDKNKEHKTIYPAIVWKFVQELASSIWPFMNKYHIISSSLYMSSWSWVETPP